MKLANTPCSLADGADRFRSAASNSAASAKIGEASREMRSHAHEVVRHRLHIPVHGLDCVRRRRDRPLRRRPLRRPDLQRRGWFSSPAALQLVDRRVRMPPGCPGERAPFERVMQRNRGGLVAPARIFRRRCRYVRLSQHGTSPVRVAAAFPDDAVEAFPVSRDNRLAPVIEVTQDGPEHPGVARIVDAGEYGAALLESACRLRRVIWFGSALTVRASRRIQIADHHVVQRDIGQSVAGR